MTITQKSEIDSRSFCILTKNRPACNLTRYMATYVASSPFLYTTKRDRLKENHYLWEINFLNI